MAQAEEPSCVYDESSYKSLSAAQLNTLRAKRYSDYAEIYRRYAQMYPQYGWYADLYQRYAERYAAYAHRDMETFANTVVYLAGNSEHDVVHLVENLLRASTSQAHESYANLLAKSSLLQTTCTYDQCPNNPNKFIDDGCGCDEVDVSLAPDSFPLEEGTAVFPDIGKVLTSIQYDIDAQRIYGHATVYFRVAESGFPIIDLDADPISVSLNSETLAAADYVRVVDPDRVTSLRTVKRAVEPNRCYTLEVSYELSNPHLIKASFSDDSVDMSFDMTDIDDLFMTRQLPRYWEAFGPTGLEYDSYKHLLTIELQSDSQIAEHRVFSNGQVTTQGNGNIFQINFPNHYATSSFFVHLAPVAKYEVLEAEQRGIPMIIYKDKDREDIDLAHELEAASAYIDQFEEDLGQYPHESFVALYKDARFQGAMEYAGATMLARREHLGHEIFHSWFARSVRPANGDAGVIDELLAEWSESGYTSQVYNPQNYSEIITGSPYARSISIDVYFRTSILPELANILERQGMNLKQVVREFFQVHVGQAVNLQMFKQFIEGQTGLDLTHFSLSK
ncbi:MAG: hypothetical protein KDD62_06195 [Bdellovibrionales bacterium]|nr:hypothetical protein [Bdellovibrionales bacterium]